MDKEEKESSDLKMWRNLFNADDKELLPIVYETQLYLMSYYCKLNNIHSRKLGEILGCAHVTTQKFTNQGRAIFWNCYILNQMILASFCNSAKVDKLIKDIPKPIQEALRWLEEVLGAKSEREDG